MLGCSRCCVLMATESRQVVVLAVAALSGC
jgi:hypothetical protein